MYTVQQAIFLVFLVFRVFLFRLLIVENEFLIRDFPLINAGGSSIHYFQLSFSLSVADSLQGMLSFQGLASSYSEPIGSLSVWA